MRTGFFSLTLHVRMKRLQHVFRTRLTKKKKKKTTVVSTHSSRGKLPSRFEIAFVVHSKPSPTTQIQILHDIKLKKRHQTSSKVLECAHSPVKAVRGRPVLGRRSCLGCRSRVIRHQEAGCREAAQRSHKVGTKHQALRHRGAQKKLLMTEIFNSLGVLIYHLRMD